MSRRAWVTLLLVSAFWGSSYMFIKIALDDGLEPGVIVFSRLLLAALVLLPLALRSGALAAVRRRPVPILVLAVIQVVVPFLLITYGEREISSSLTGILVATVPLFTFLLAFVLEGEERAGKLSLVGVAIGLLGVGLLLGLDTGGGAGALVGGLMVVLASLGYGLGAWFLKRNFAGVPPLGVLTGTMATATVLTLPLALAGLPSTTPGAKAIGSLVVLGVVGTAITFLLFYGLVGSEGPARASLVGYIAPAFSVAYGVALLSEGFTVTTAVGLLLIVGGSWLAAEGRAPWQPRREPVEQEHDHGTARRSERLVPS